MLGILYESFVHPVTILSGLPSAGLGALLTLMIFGSELNIYGFVGLIMLIGIVKKNAIMQIDFALDAQRNEGKSALDAIYQGCLCVPADHDDTLAALLGALRSLSGIGGGASSRRTLGLAGLRRARVLAAHHALPDPVYYYYLDRLFGLATVRGEGVRRSRHRHRVLEARRHDLVARRGMTISPGQRPGNPKAWNRQP